jgi:hypothetical protein
LQAGGHRFESGCLHFDRFAKGEHGREANVRAKSPGLVSVRRRRRQPRSGCQEAIPRRGGARSDASFWRSKVRDALPDRARAKVQAPGSGPVGQTRCEPPLTNSNCIAERSRDRGAGVLEKDRPRHVNRRNAGDFVLCQGESGSGASLGACDGSGIVCRVRPAVWLMSDREIRGVCQSTSRKPLCQAASVQRRLCELIRMNSVLLKERTDIRVLCRR